MNIDTSDPLLLGQTLVSSIGNGTKGLKQVNTGSDTFANAGEGAHEEVSVGVVIGIEGGCCCKKKVRR